ncbi:unnamed protein product [Taenia asiatica]|uniref:Uncharacterized protein n=1 Tax=Taenia asiatica TaxID=60517 RepID=A0A0R3VYK3_TAEAS|nr:unnamed protein product [Taenia asiatica]
MQLVRALPPLKRQIDALLAFDAPPSELFTGVLLATTNFPTKRVARSSSPIGRQNSNDLSKASPTLSLPSTIIAVARDLILLRDASNHQNLSTEQQCIMGEERQRLETFVSQARANCSATTPGHASSGVDVLQLSPGPTSGGSASRAATASSLFDVFSPQPALPAPSSQMALSTITTVQARPLPQSLWEPSSTSAATNPNNPFLPPNPFG